MKFCSRHSSVLINAATIEKIKKIASDVIVKTLKKQRLSASFVDRSNTSMLMFLLPESIKVIKRERGRKS